MLAGDGYMGVRHEEYIQANHAKYKSRKNMKRCLNLYRAISRWEHDEGVGAVGKSCKESKQVVTSVPKQATRARNRRGKWLTR